jgi:AbrB family looped-hinge helix DNA binding protein
METRATIKGQIVIPAALRRKYNIQGGTRIQVYEEKGRIILHPVNRETIQKVRGLFKGPGALKLLREEREKERDV